MRAKPTKLIASASCLACLAAILAILPLSFSYPIIPYLKFDFAEIPVFLAFLLMGPEAGFISSIVYWLVLLLVGSYTPLGPTMKFAAVTSTLLGFWLGFKALKTPRGGLILGLILGCILRVLAMSLFNYVALICLFPELLDFAAASISAFLGISFSSRISAFTTVAAFTAIFNILHVPLSIAPAYFIVRSIVNLGRGSPRISEIWYAEVARAASRRPPPRS
ncbi:MAG: hypothetical protein DRN61_03700 [Thaumarchaeota archaeon]|nr:MAG: hypothetical protein DRN54_02945 [Nitrososphaerota archaeon]RLG04105.1 MAG: hypothetical protein DRN61_03700 [Nitrososphaerota archaeon]HDD43216.1 hypothetical protein [Nitrososphaeria archaeon]